MDSSGISKIFELLDFALWLFELKRLNTGLLSLLWGKEFKRVAIGLSPESPKNISDLGLFNNKSSEWLLFKLGVGFNEMGLFEGDVFESFKDIFWVPKFNWFVARFESLILWICLIESVELLLLEFSDISSNLILLLNAFLFSSLSRDGGSERNLGKKEGDVGADKKKEDIEADAVDFVGTKFSAIGSKNTGFE